MSGERGFLTSTDRKFLAGKQEYTGENAKQQRYERRKLIAERARQAFYDFAFLCERLPPEERNRVFDPDESEAPELREAIQDTIRFLYLSLEGEVEHPIPRDRGFRASFAEVFEPGVKQAVRDRQPKSERQRAQLFSDHGYVAYEPFSVEYKRNPPVPDPDSVIRQLVDEGPHALSDGELRELIRLATRETAAPEPADPPPEEYEPFDLHELADRVAAYADSRGREGDPLSSDDDRE